MQPTFPIAQVSQNGIVVATNHVIFQIMDPDSLIGMEQAQFSHCSSYKSRFKEPYERLCETSDSPHHGRGRIGRVFKVQLLKYQFEKPMS